MTTQFEFRLVGGWAPSGELSVDDTIALAQSLKEVATKLSRNETDAEPVGRPSRKTSRLAQLMVALSPGSTRVLVRRAGPQTGALDFDLDEEESFDARFAQLVESIAADERPVWMSDTLAIAAGGLRGALSDAAPIVEFSVGGKTRARFETANTHGVTWLPLNPTPTQEKVTFIGRLRAVNLDTHRLQATDDVGNKVALIDVADDIHAGGLLGNYVSVAGTPVRDENGRLTQIQAPTIEPAPTMHATSGAKPAVPLAEILARASGPVVGGVAGVTDEEAEAFLQVIGL